MLTSEAQDRLDRRLADLDLAFFNDLQRLVKWTGDLEKHGPCDEVFREERLWNPSLDNEVIRWKPTELPWLDNEEMSQALRQEVERFSRLYLIESFEAVHREWGSVGLRPAQFDERMRLIEDAIASRLRDRLSEASDCLQLGDSLTEVRATLCSQIKDLGTRGRQIYTRDFNLLGPRGDDQGGQPKQPTDSKLPAPSESDSGVRRRKPGPTRDVETALKVKDAVEKVVPNGAPWQSHLDDVCAELDDREIPRPKGWSGKDIRNWSDASTTDHRDLARKAISHHLKNARQP